MRQRREGGWRQCGKEEWEEERRKTGGERHNTGEHRSLRERECGRDSICIHTPGDRHSKKASLREAIHICVFS